MAGTGDLLDAIVERTHRKRVDLQHVDAVEICPKTAQVCRERLAAWAKLSPGLCQHVYSGSAFASAILDQLEVGSYDLVITNPPYVRYQTVARNGSNGAQGEPPDVIRRGLLAVVDRFPLTSERSTWRALVEGYSGLSDLSVPSWLLAAMLVKPGGVLALVAPATWRNRDYADVLQYLLARFFSLETVVTDRQPGWFSRALVRTHLVVAGRLHPHQTRMPLLERNDRSSSIQWVEIDASASESTTLVGAAFPTRDPEGDFARWVFDEPDVDKSPLGIRRTQRPQQEEVAAVLSRCSPSGWFPKVEPTSADMPLFAGICQSPDCSVPYALADALPTVPEALTTLEHLGIQVGQGLRTGCNDFFYVDLVDFAEHGLTTVRLSALFGRAEIDVPSDALVPVLRKQSELKSFAQRLSLSGRALLLSGYVLPDDHVHVERAKAIYERLVLVPPVVMPTGLADHVRSAATLRPRGTKGGVIPELSAVRTNARPAVAGRKPKPPRFWYMLPDLARRHVPDVFVPRVNQRSPLAMPNRSDSVVVDANFSTLWSEDTRWTANAIAALLRSSWSRACMEATGTPMGGGALKLEATHLRRLPMPVLDEDHIRELASIDRTCPPKLIDQVIARALLRGESDTSRMSQMNGALHSFVDAAERARQRA